MKQTINFNDFRQAFTDYNREEYFSDEGLELLFNCLSAIEDDTGVEFELDVIALCCDFSEDDLKDIADNCDIDIDGMDLEEASEEVESYLTENTFLIGTTGTGFIYQAF